MRSSSPSDSPAESASLISSVDDAPDRNMPLYTLAAVSLPLLTGVAIYWNFLFGGMGLLYKDIGSDSINFSYPYFVHLSDYVRENGMPSWSFHVGMGHSLFPYSSWLLIHPVTWLPKKAIAPALVYEHLLKTVLAGILMFKFLR